MEMPIHLAIETTTGWNHSDVELGESELALELVEQDDGSIKKYFLIGDGFPVGPDGAGPDGRLRVKPDMIAGLSETLGDMKARIKKLEDLIIQLTEKGN